MPSNRSKKDQTPISLESLWITFTIILIGFLLCFIIWGIARHFSHKNRRRRNAGNYGSYDDDDEEQECGGKSCLKDLATEFGYRDSRRHQNEDPSSKLLVIRNSYNPNSISSCWRSSLVQSNNTNRPKSTSSTSGSNNNSNSRPNSLGSSSGTPTDKNKINPSHPPHHHHQTSSHHSHVCLDVIQEDEDESIPDNPTTNNNVVIDKNDDL